MEAPTSTVNGGAASNTSQEVNEEIIEAVRKQVEYYFSKENLQTDRFLLSVMDGNNSVPISTIMGVRKRTYFSCIFLFYILISFHFFSLPR